MNSHSKVTTVERWQDAEHFRARIQYWAARIQVKPKAVHIRPMKKKWASCSTKGNVSFSTQLLEESQDFGEYAIVHELIHLKIPNHGKLFRSFLTAHMPDWKERVDLTSGSTIGHAGLDSSSID